VTAECVRCSRPMADQAYACQACADKAAEQLRTIVDMTPAARDVAHGQSRRSGGGGASGKPESRLPFDLGATSKLDAVQGELTGWVRHVAEERGLIMSPGWPAKGSDLIVEAAEWLLGHLGWLRHRQEVSEALSGIAAAARIVAGIARGPAAQRFLGPCGAGTIECKVCQSTDIDHHRDCDMTCPHKFIPGSPCEGDVYAREGGSVGRCRTCGAEVSTAERQAWLDGEVRSRAFRASEIANAYGVNVKTIRSWAARGHLIEHGHDRDGHPLYPVGDVLDLAAADAARRETERAKRERRAATRATEDERLSA
jgi:hypothetical protein